MNMNYGLQQIHMAMNIIIEDLTGIEIYPHERDEEDEHERGRYEDEL